MPVGDEYTDEGTVVPFNQEDAMELFSQGDIAKSFRSGRLNLYKDILDEEHDLGIAASKYGTNQSIGSLIGNYALPGAMSLLLSGGMSSPLLTSVIGKAALGGVGSILGGKVGGGLTKDRYKELLTEKGGRFLGSDREELRTHMDESLYAQSIKNAIQSGAIDALDLDLFGKKERVDEDGWSIDPTYGEPDKVGFFERLFGKDDPRSITDSPSYRADEQQKFIERQKVDSSDTIPEGGMTFADKLKLGGVYAGAAVTAPFAAVGGVAKKGWEGLAGLVDELKNLEMYKTVIDEEGNRVKVPWDAKSEKDLTPGFLGSGINLKDIKFPKFERIKPKVAVPERDPIFSRGEQVQVYDTGRRWPFKYSRTAPTGESVDTKSADRVSLAERLGFRLNPATQRLLGMESTMNISDEMAGLVDIIASGQWTSEDLIQFQELSGLEPTGSMDMETANMLRTMGR